jgi:hypothetical protein
LQSVLHPDQDSVAELCIKGQEAGALSE